MRQKIKVSKEIYRNNLSIGYCPFCIYYDPKTDSCTIEEEANYRTAEEARIMGYDLADATKMDCVMWDYIYEVE